MKEERNHHLDNEKDSRKEKGNQKEEYERDEMQNIGDVQDKEKELEVNLKDLQATLENSKKNLI